MIKHYNCRILVTTKRLNIRPNFNFWTQKIKSPNLEDKKYQGFDIFLPLI